MSSKFLARELSKRDNSLCLFLPLLTDMVDYSGRHSHMDLVYDGGDNVYPNVYLAKVDRQYYDKKTGILFNRHYGNDKLVYGMCNQNSVGSSISIQKGFTVSLWFKIDSQWPGSGQSSFILISKMLPIGKGASIPQGYELSLVGSGSTYSEKTLQLQWKMITNGSPMGSQTYIKKIDLYKNDPLFPKEWIHVVVTYSDILRIFIDGKPIQSSPEDYYFYTDPREDINNNNYPILIGGDYTRQVLQFLSVCLVRLYQRALPYRDIYKLYSRELDLYNNRKAYAITNTKSSIPLYITGPSVLTNSVSLMVFGNYVNQTVPLIITGEATNSSVPLYINSYQKNSSSLNLIVNGATVQDASLNLFTLSPDPNYQVSPIPLYVYGISANASGQNVGYTNLFINGGATNQKINLFTVGPNSDSVPNNINLFVSGEAHKQTSSVPLFINNISKEWNIPLITVGYGYAEGLQNNASRGINLYIERPTANAVSLFIAASTPINNALPLLTRASLAQDNSLSLNLPKTVGNPAGMASLFITGW